MAIWTSGSVTTANVTREWTSVKHLKSSLRTASAIESSVNFLAGTNYIFVVCSGSAHNHANFTTVIKKQPVHTGISVISGSVIWFVGSIVLCLSVTYFTRRIIQ